MYHRHHEALSSPEDKEQAALHFSLRDSDIFEYRKQIVDWIELCEECLSAQLDRITEARSSQGMHLPHESRLSTHTSSARIQERARTQNFLNRFTSLHIPWFNISSLCFNKLCLHQSSWYFGVANALKCLTKFCLLTWDLPIILSVTFHTHS